MLKESLLKLMPGPMICYLGQPYVSGYSMQAGLNKAIELLKEGRLSTIDLLGEESHTNEQVRETMTLYRNLIITISEQSGFESLTTRPTVSLKPSSLVTARVIGDRLELDENALEQNLRDILSHAREHKVELTIDMEDFHWTDVTLQLYKKFHTQGFPSLGTVIQSRLFRTEEDIKNLPDNCRIRLCIGIYKEAAAIALTDKKAMKEKLLVFAGMLLEKNAFLELATHDENVLDQFFHDILPQFPFPENRLEVQMLLGVPRSEVQQKLMSGALSNGVPIPVRLYVPFAVDRKDATEYTRRRLIANPDMIGYGIRNILGRLSGSGS